jgi:hypothetical protein
MTSQLTAALLAETQRQLREPAPSTSRRALLRTLLGAGR